MEYSIDAVAGKMILVIVVLSILISIGGAIYFQTVDEAAPFAAGVAMTMALNIAKVLLLKKAVANSLTKDAFSAKAHLQYTYFLRLILTAAVLVAAALIPDNFVNLFGAVFGIFTLHISSYSMRYFFRHALADEIIASSANIPSSPTHDAIQEINAIVSEYDEAKDGIKISK